MENVKSIYELDDKPQPTHVYTPPRALSPKFTGQEMYLQRLREYFEQPSQKPQRKCFLLHGTGGVGKTQLALKYAEENVDQYVIQLLSRDATGH